MRKTSALFKMNSFLKQAVAIFTIACFLLTGVCGQVIAALLQSEQERGRFEQVLGDYVIPAANGRISEARYFGSDTVVINIQDLHCHPEVQENICSLLDALSKKYAIRRLYLEGAAGELDPWCLTCIEDRKLRDRVLDSLVKKGELTGAEKFAVQSADGVKLYGLEDKALYDENSLRLGRIREKQPQIDELLSAMRQRLDGVKDEYYNRRQKNFEATIDNYRAGRLDTRKYYSLLSKHAKSQTIDSGGYTNLAGYLLLLEREKRLNYKRISLQMSGFLGVLKQRLSYSDYHSLLEKTDNFSRLDELYRLLAEMAESHHFAVRSRYPDLARFFDYVNASRRLNPLSLVGEEKLLTEELQLSFAENNSEREVASLLNGFRRLEDFLKSRITADDYAVFMDDFEQFRVLYRCYTEDADSLALLDGYYTLLRDYYRANTDRNDRFMQAMFGNGDVQPGQLTPPDTNGGNIERTVASLATAKEIVVLVAGGFHTEGISRLLDRRGISHLEILPNVTGDNRYAELVYWKKLGEQNKVLSQAFAVEKLIAKPLAEQLAQDVGGHLDVLNGEFPAAKTEEFIQGYFKALDEKAKMTGKPELNVTFKMLSRQEEKKVRFELLLPANQRYRYVYDAATGEVSIEGSGASAKRRSESKFSAVAGSLIVFLSTILMAVPGLSFNKKEKETPGKFLERQYEKAGREGNGELVTVFAQGSDKPFGALKRELRERLRQQKEKKVRPVGIRHIVLPGETDLALFARTHGLLTMAHFVLKKNRDFRYTEDHINLEAAKKELKEGVKNNNIISRYILMRVKDKGPIDADALMSFAENGKGSSEMADIDALTKDDLIPVFNALKKVTSLDTFAVKYGGIREGLLLPHVRKALDFGRNHKAVKGRYDYHTLNMVNTALLLEMFPETLGGYDRNDIVEYVGGNEVGMHLLVDADEEHGTATIYLVEREGQNVRDDVPDDVEPGEWKKTVDGLTASRGATQAILFLKGRLPEFSNSIATLLGIESGKLDPKNILLIGAGAAFVDLKKGFKDWNRIGTDTRDKIENIRFSALVPDDYPLSKKLRDGLNISFGKRSNNDNGGKKASDALPAMDEDRKMIADNGVIPSVDLMPDPQSEQPDGDISIIDYDSNGTPEEEQEQKDDDSSPGGITSKDLAGLDEFLEGKVVVNVLDRFRKNERAMLEAQADKGIRTAAITLLKLPGITPEEFVRKRKLWYRKQGDEAEIKHWELKVTINFRNKKEVSSFPIVKETFYTRNGNPIVVTYVFSGGNVIDRGMPRDMDVSYRKEWNDAIDMQVFSLVSQRLVWIMAKKGHKYFAELKFRRKGNNDIGMIKVHGRKGALLSLPDIKQANSKLKYWSELPYEIPVVAVTNYRYSMHRLVTDRLSIAAFYYTPDPVPLNEFVAAHLEPLSSLREKLRANNEDTAALSGKTNLSPPSDEGKKEQKPRKHRLYAALAVSFPVAVVTLAALFSHTGIFSGVLAGYALHAVGAMTLLPIITEEAVESWKSGISQRWLPGTGAGGETIIGVDQFSWARKISVLDRFLRRRFLNRMFKDLKGKPLMTVSAGEDGLSVEAQMSKYRQMADEQQQNDVIPVIVGLLKLAPGQDWMSLSAKDMNLVPLSQYGVTQRIKQGMNYYDPSQINREALVQELRKDNVLSRLFIDSIENIDSITVKRLKFLSQHMTTTSSAEISKEKLEHLTDEAVAARFNRILSLGSTLPKFIRYDENRISPYAADILKEMNAGKPVSWGNMRIINASILQQYFPGTVSETDISVEIGQTKDIDIRILVEKTASGIIMYVVEPGQQGYRNDALADESGTYGKIIDGLIMEQVVRRLTGNVRDARDGHMLGYNVSRLLKLPKNEEYLARHIFLNGSKSALANIHRYLQSQNNIARQKMSDITVYALIDEDFDISQKMRNALGLVLGSGKDSEKISRALVGVNFENKFVSKKRHRITGPHKGTETSGKRDTATSRTTGESTRVLPLITRESLKAYNKYFGNGRMIISVYDDFDDETRREVLDEANLGAIPVAFMLDKLPANMSLDEYTEKYKLESLDRVSIRYKKTKLEFPLYLEMLTDPETGNLASVIHIIDDGRTIDRIVNPLNTRAENTAAKIRNDMVWRDSVAAFILSSVSYRYIIKLMMPKQTELRSVFGFTGDIDMALLKLIGPGAAMTANPSMAINSLYTTPLPSKLIVTGTNDEALIIPRQIAASDGLALKAGGADFNVLKFVDEYANKVSPVMLRPLMNNGKAEIDDLNKLMRIVTKFGGRKGKQLLTIVGGHDGLSVEEQMQEYRRWAGTQARNGVEHPMILGLLKLPLGMNAVSFAKGRKNLLPLAHYTISSRIGRKDYYDRSEINRKALREELRNDNMITRLFIKSIDSRDSVNSRTLLALIEKMKTDPPKFDETKFDRLSDEDITSIFNTIVNLVALHKVSSDTDQFAPYAQYPLNEPIRMVNASILLHYFPETLWNADAPVALGDTEDAGIRVLVEKYSTGEDKYGLIFYIVEPEGQSYRKREAHDESGSYGKVVDGLITAQVAWSLVMNFHDPRKLVFRKNIAVALGVPVEEFRVSDMLLIGAKVALANIKLYLKTFPKSVKVKIPDVSVSAVVYDDFPFSPLARELLNSTLGKDVVLSDRPSGALVGVGSENQLVLDDRSSAPRDVAKNQSSSEKESVADVVARNDTETLKITRKTLNAYNRFFVDRMIISLDKELSGTADTTVRTAAQQELLAQANMGAFSIAFTLDRLPPGTSLAEYAKEHDLKMQKLDDVIIYKGSLSNHKNHAVSLYLEIVIDPVTKKKARVIHVINDGTFEKKMRMSNPLHTAGEDISEQKNNDQKWEESVDAFIFSAAASQYIRYLTSSSIMRYRRKLGFDKKLDVVLLKVLSSDGAMAVKPEVIFREFETPLSRRLIITATNDKPLVIPAEASGYEGLGLADGGIDLDVRRYIEKYANKVAPEEGEIAAYTAKVVAEYAPRKKTIKTVALILPFAAMITAGIVSWFSAPAGADMVSSGTVSADMGVGPVVGFLVGLFLMQWEVWRGRRGTGASAVAVSAGDGGTVREEISGGLNMRAAYGGALSAIRTARDTVTINSIAQKATTRYRRPKSFLLENAPDLMHRLSVNLWGATDAAAEIKIAELSNNDEALPAELEKIYEERKQLKETLAAQADLRMNAAAFSWLKGDPETVARMNLLKLFSLPVRYRGALHVFDVLAEEVAAPKGRTALILYLYDADGTVPRGGMPAGADEELWNRAIDDQAYAAGVQEALARMQYDATVKRVLNKRFRVARRYQLNALTPAVVHLASADAAFALRRLDTVDFGGTAAFGEAPVLARFEDELILPGEIANALGMASNDEQGVSAGRLAHRYADRTLSPSAADDREIVRKTLPWLPENTIKKIFGSAVERREKLAALSALLPFRRKKAEDGVTGAKSGVAFSFSIKENNPDFYPGTAEGTLSGLKANLDRLALKGPVIAIVKDILDADGGKGIRPETARQAREALVIDGKVREDIDTVFDYRIGEDGALSPDLIHTMIAGTGFAGVQLDFRASRQFPSPETLRSIRHKNPGAWMLIVPPADPELKARLQDMLKEASVSAIVIEPYALGNGHGMLPARGPDTGLYVYIPGDTASTDGWTRESMRTQIDTAVNSRVPLIVFEFNPFAGTGRMGPDSRDDIAGTTLFSPLFIESLMKEVIAGRLSIAKSSGEMQENAFRRGAAAANPDNIRVEVDDLRSVLEDLRQVRTVTLPLPDGYTVKSHGLNIFPMIRSHLKGAGGNGIDRQALNDLLFSQFDAVAAQSSLRKKGEYWNLLIDGVEEIRDRHHPDAGLFLLAYVDGFLRETLAKAYPRNYEFEDAEYETAWKELFLEVDSLLAVENRRPTVVGGESDPEMKTFINMKMVEYLMMIGRADFAEAMLNDTARAINRQEPVGRLGSLMFVEAVNQHAARKDNEAEELKSPSPAFYRTRLTSADNMPFLLSGVDKGLSIVDAVEKVIGAYKVNAHPGIGEQAFYRNGAKITGDIYRGLSPMYREKMAASVSKLPVIKAETRGAVEKYDPDRDYASPDESLKEFLSEHLPAAASLSHNGDMANKEAFRKLLLRMSTSSGLQISPNSPVITMYFSFLAAAQIHKLVNRDLTPDATHAGIKRIIEPMLDIRERYGYIPLTLAANGGMTTADKTPSAVTAAGILELLHLWAEKKVKTGSISEAVNVGVEYTKSILAAG